MYLVYYFNEIRKKTCIPPYCTCVDNNSLNKPRRRTCSGVCDNNCFFSEFVFSPETLESKILTPFRNLI